MAIAADIRTLPLHALVLSQTPIQVERRAQFDKNALKDLAATIQSVGRVEHAITVRPVDGGNRFEVADGERRVLATELAGLEDILAEVRDLTDEHVEQIQIVTGLQKEGLHELVEAEGYETLQKRGLSIDEICAKCGKSKATVYARMKLLALCPSSRTAFRSGKISASVALLAARIPVEKLQQEFVKQVLKGWGGDPMSYRDAADLVQREYMLRLADASFPTGIELAGEGPCGKCPRRTGNQPTLFDDVKSADVCTDPPCFRKKTAAHAQSIAAKAKASGQTVITGNKAKQIAPHGAGSSLRGFARVDERCYSDPKNRTVRQLIGKDAETALLQDPETGALIEVVKESRVDDALKAAGVRRGASTNGAEVRRAKKQREEKVFRIKLYDAVREKLPSSLGRPELELLALTLFSRLWHETRKLLFPMWGWEPRKGKAYAGERLWDETVEEQVPKMSDATLARFLQDCCYIGDLQVSSYSDAKPELLLAAAKRLKINADKLRAEAAPAPKASKMKAAMKRKSRK